MEQSFVKRIPVSNLTAINRINRQNKKSTQDEQKIQLIIAAVFRYITEPSKKYIIYAKSRNIEMRAGDDTNDIVIKLLDTFLENQTNYEMEVAICLNVSILHLYNFIQ